MGKSDNTAINEAKIDNCVIELTNYVEKLKKVFINLDEAINSTSNYYQTEEGIKLRNKFSIFKDNFDITVNNMISYIDELKAVKREFNMLNDQLSVDILKNANDLKSSYDYLIGRSNKEMREWKD